MRLLTEPAPRRQTVGPQPGTVVRSLGRDLYVTVDGLGGLEVGPCAWGRPLAQTTTHSHAAGSGQTGTAVLVYDPMVPPAGTRCLLLFAGEGLKDPWIVAFDQWPS